MVAEAADEGGTRSLVNNAILACKSGIRSRGVRAGFASMVSIAGRVSSGEDKIVGGMTVSGQVVDDVDVETKR